MYWKRLIAFILTWIIPLQVYAYTVAELNGFHQIPTYTFNSTSELTGLYDIAQKYVVNPTNKKSLQTKEGQVLLANQRKLRNYLEIKKAFEACLEKRKTNDKTINEKNYARIINAAGSINAIEVGCRTENENFSSLNSFSKHIQSLSKNLELNEIQKKLYDQSLKNTIKTYLHLKQQVGVKVNPKELIKSFCPGNRCENRQDILDYMYSYQKKIKGVTSFTHLEIQNEINDKINLINTQLVEVKAGVDKGWFNTFAFDTSDPIFSDKAEQAYDNYQQTYISAASSGFGKLLMTKSLRDKVGHLKSKEDDIVEDSDSSLNTTKYYYEDHVELNDKDVKNALQDAFKTMEKQSFRLNTMNNFRLEDKDKLENPGLFLDPQDKGNHSAGLGFSGNRLRDIKKLVKTNPAATGELLLNYPELAPTICEALGIIQDDQDTDEFWDEAFFWGGLVVGGLLLGGGLIAMGGMLLARGAAATAFYSSLGTGVTAAGLVTGTIESVYWTDEVIEAQMDITSSQMAYISGLTDKEAIAEIKSSMEDLNNAIFNLSLSLAFTAVDVASMYFIIRGAKLAKAGDSSVENLRQLQLVKMKSIMDRILGDTKLLKLFNKLTKKIGKQKVAKFIALLGHLTDETLNQVLASLNGKGINKAVELIEKSLKSLRGCV